MLYFMEMLQLIPLMVFWILHLLLVIYIAKPESWKTFEIQTASVFFIFYSIAALFEFEFDFFSYRYKHSPDLVALVTYVICDLLFLFIIKFLYKKNLSLDYNIGEVHYGNAVIFWMAFLAEGVHVYFNNNLFVLPKDEYIAALGEAVPNLLLISIPAESILVAALVNNPFEKRVLRIVAFGAGGFSVLLSVFLGYRHLVLIFLLVILFKRKPNFSVIAIVLALTFVGEFSNDLKIIFAKIIINDDFDISAYLDWTLNRDDRILISGEQAAIVSNFQIGFLLNSFGNDFIELIGLFPFLSGFGVDFQSGTDKIGSFVGVGYGQGTAYNFQLFLLNTIFIGSFLLLLSVFLMKNFKNTVLLIYGIEIFYSILRNSPRFWSSQIKMFIFLAIFMLVCSYFWKMTSASFSRRLDYCKIQ